MASVLPYSSETPLGEVGRTLGAGQAPAKPRPRLDSPKLPPTIGPPSEDIEMEVEPPRLSVVMSVRDGGAGVRVSIESVLRQDGTDFELIIVNDGSGREVSEMLRALATKDHRIRLVEQPNQGLTLSLIRGCALARAPIIVRQDAGDRSLPGRFGAILAEFERYPAAAIVSSWCDMVGPGGEHLFTTKRGADPEANRRALLHDRLGPPCHPATAFRRSAYEMVGGYRPQFVFAQDADLWLRLAEQGTFACIQETLYEATMHLNGISATRATAQRLFGEYAHACRAARLRGDADPPPPSGMLTASSPLDHRRARAKATYFIGSCLYARGDVRGRPYLAEAWRLRPWDLRPALKSLLGRSRSKRRAKGSQ